MVEGKRRCHSTSEAPFLLQPFKSASSDDAFCDEAEEEEYTSTGHTRLIPQTQRQTSVERRDFSRRLSLTSERMKETKRLLSNSSTGSMTMRTNSSFLLLDSQGGRPAPPKPLQRRMSVLVDEQRQPVALLQSDGNAVSIRPVLRNLTSATSVTKLFDDPYGLAEEPRTSNISMPQFTRDPSTTSFLTDKKEFEKQCQWKGERVKSTDYMLLNITALFIITVIVAAIIFFSLWRDVSGKMWALYLGLGVAAALVLLALLLVRLHFCLKSRGYNFLFRFQNNPPPVPVKKNLDQIKESESLQVDLEGASEKVENSEEVGEEGDSLL